METCTHASQHGAACAAVAACRAGLALWAMRHARQQLLRAQSLQYSQSHLARVMTTCAGCSAKVAAAHWAGARAQRALRWLPSLLATPTTQHVPLCRLLQLAATQTSPPTGTFTMGGMTVRPGAVMDITFTLAQPGVVSECVRSDAALLPSVRLLSFPCRKRANAPAAAVPQKQLDAAVAVQCRRVLGSAGSAKWHQRCMPAGGHMAS